MLPIPHPTSQRGVMGQAGVRVAWKRGGDVPWSDPVVIIQVIVEA